MSNPMNEKTLLSALDIGTTKICAVIGEYDRSTSEYHIRGIGKVPSAGMKGGVVIDIDQMSRCIENAVKEALKQAGLDKINGVIIGIAGDHIRSHDTEHAIPINRPDNSKKINVIDERDIVRLEESVKNINIGIDREIIHVIAQEYIINDQMIVKNPIGMSGNKLTLKANIITAAINNARDLVNCVQKTGLNVYDIVLEPIASAESVLTYDQKDLCLPDRYRRRDHGYYHFPRRTSGQHQYCGLGRRDHYPRYRLPGPNLLYGSRTHKKTVRLGDGKTGKGGGHPGILCKTRQRQDRYCSEFPHPFGIY